VAADELAGLDVAFQLAREVAAALLLGLAAAVGEEDVRSEREIGVSVLFGTEMGEARYGIGWDSAS
jgi:hypothetical protein